MIPHFYTIQHFDIIKKALFKILTQFDVLTQHILTF
jgi:hypothetical protein